MPAAAKLNFRWAVMAATPCHIFGGRCVYINLLHSHIGGDREHHDHAALMQLVLCWFHIPKIGSSALTCHKLLCYNLRL